MSGRATIGELRTALTGLDPGLVRLRFAGIATASMLLAALVMSGVAMLAGQPVTVVLISAVLAMVSNLAVNEPELQRRRVTTLLMVLPAVVAVTAGTLLAPHRVVADIVFVAVMVGAVYVRRFGPRGNALGMAAVMPYFFTQFLQAAPAQLPWLLLATGVGLGATLLLRGFVFAERTDRTLERLVRAFRAHVHALVIAVVDLLGAEPDEVEHELRQVRRRRTRLNDTALLVADLLEQRAEKGDAEKGDATGHDGREASDRAAEGADEGLELRIVDAELAAERLAVATRRLVQGDSPPADDVRRRLLAGLRSLGSATATGAPAGMVPVLLDGARRGVAPLVAETDGLGDRAQRVAFAVSRLADALGTGDDVSPHRSVGDPAGPDRNRPHDEPPAPDDVTVPGGGDPAGTDGPSGLPLATRQAVQVGVATSLAIVLGELVSPGRWYWAVISAFVVFAGTTSRGDVLSRGSQRVVGTIGGVVAGMGLAVLVGGVPAPALVLMFGCVFLAMYLVRVSQALMAFWITTVLALLYGLIGQFSLETLVVRVEETAVGAAMGMLAGYLVLPTKTREAFAEALDKVVDSADAVLEEAVDRIVGRAPGPSAVELARDMDDALAVLRLRAAPLDNPLPRRRGRGSYQRALRVLTSVDHYARRLARISDTVDDEGWAPTLDPAAERVRSNLDGLRRLLQHRHTGGGDTEVEIRSAEELVDAAEAYAARLTDQRRRAELLIAVRLLRRIDQAVVGFATDLAPLRQTATHGP